MRNLSAVALLVLLAVSRVYAGGPPHEHLEPRVHLEPGEQRTLRVGQIVDLQLHSVHRYTVTFEGDALAPLTPDRNGLKYSYRAVHPGTAMLMIVPGARKPGECIDCVTRRCFLTVVP